MARLLLLATFLVGCGGFDPKLTDVSATLANYNTFLREASGETLGVFPPSDPACRATQLATVLSASGYDLVGLQESFDTGLTSKLAQALEQPYPRQAVGLPDRCTAPDGCRTSNGGLDLLAGRRIRVMDDQPRVLTFSACDSDDGQDCLAAKGALLWRVFIAASTEVENEGRFLNLVTLHLDSGSNAASVTARAAQLDQLRAFLETEVCGSSERKGEPIVVMGDFNVAHVGPTATAVNAEYQDLKSRLETSCSKTARDAYLEARAGWEETDAEAGTTTCEGGRLIPSCTPPAPPSRRLDYLWVLNPVDGAVAARVEQARTRALETTACQAPFLSDHKLVETSLRFETSTAEPF